MGEERDYVLGTDDVELDRLGLQHAVWRPRAHDAWQRAGFTVGQHLLDVGCGPGYASADLAEMVGRGGQVVGVDRSTRFLEAARARANAGGLTWTSFRERDLDGGALPVTGADGAWIRWVMAFVTRPRELLARIRAALRPGGALVIHEYVDYASWRLAPRSDAFETFVGAVMASWREAGGEPDIALALPSWLREDGYDILSVRPLVDVVAPNHFIWQWPAAFARSGLPRLVASGHLDPATATDALRDLSARENDPGALMVTPAVMEIIAIRR